MERLIPTNYSDDPFIASYADPQMLTPNFGRNTPDPAPDVIDFARIHENGASVVDPMAGIMPFPGGPEIPSQNIERDLMKLRNQVPFVPIMRMPIVLRTVFFPTANQARDLAIPNDCAVGRIRCTGLCVVSRNGSAQPLIAASFPANGSNDDENQFGGMLWEPTDNDWYYFGDVGTLSVLATLPGTVIQFQGIPKVL